MDHLPPLVIVPLRKTHVLDKLQFTYVVNNLLQLQPTDNLYISFMSNGFSEFGDLVALSSEETDNLSYPDPDPEGVLPIPVVRGLTNRLKILIAMYLKWSYVHGQDINIETVTLPDFYNFRTREYNP